MHNIVLLGTTGNGLCGLWGKRERGLVEPWWASRVCGSGAVEMLGIVIKGGVSGKTRIDLSIWVINVTICNIVGI